MKFTWVLIMLSFLTSCAFISGVQNAKNVPPAPKETATSQTTAATATTAPTPPASTYNQNTPADSAHKMIQPLTF